MAALHNRISRKELKQLIQNDPTHRKTISFYNYTHIDDPKKFRDELYLLLKELNVLGRIYVAHEGVNAQVSVPDEKIESFISCLNSITGFSGVRLNIAVDNNVKSFYVLDVKVKKKIVADGIDDPSFDMRKKGKYVNAREFNEFSRDPETIIIDMRNHYEYEVGHFKNSIEVPSDTFREQLPMVAEMMKEKMEKTIIMYCTGGIRCEKASAFMLHKGFKNVFHLEGGIIHYANQVKEQGLESEFIGKNFVFDERLGERVSDEIIAYCHQCGESCDIHVNCANDACHLLFIQCEQCRKKYEDCCSEKCQEFIHLPGEQQKLLRKGLDKGQNIFNKAKARKKGISAGSK